MKRYSSLHDFRNLGFQTSYDSKHKSKFDTFQSPHITAKNNEAEQSKLIYNLPREHESLKSTQIFIIEKDRELAKQKIEMEKLRTIVAKCGKESQDATQLKFEKNKLKQENEDNLLVIEKLKSDKEGLTKRIEAVKLSKDEEIERLNHTILLLKRKLLQLLDGKSPTPNISQDVTHSDETSE